MNNAERKQLIEEILSLRAQYMLLGGNLPPAVLAQDYTSYPVRELREVVWHYKHMVVVISE